MGMKRTFTLSEAEALLPVLRGLLRRAMAARRKMRLIEGEFERARAHVFASGGAELDVLHFVRRRAESDKLAQQIKEGIAEIHAAGAQVKDLDMGLLDFPSVVDGNLILLCWRMGEEHITHWHGMDEGFAGRKPIDERIARIKPKMQ